MTAEEIRALEFAQLVREIAASAALPVIAFLAVTVICAWALCGEKDR